MNKDLYIELLEEHVDDLTTASKIDTLLTSRKTAYMREQELQLLTLVNRNITQGELLSKVADTAMDYRDEINDLQADWADDHVTTKIALETVTSQRTMANGFSVEQQGKIFELREDNKSLTKERDLFWGIIKDLKKEKYDMGMELEKLKKENAELGSQILDYKEDILNLQEQLGV